MQANLLPYLAAAVAHNPRAMQRLEKLVAPNRAEIVALGEKHMFARHRVVVMGRAEHIVSARLMLGYWDFLDPSAESNNKLMQILRAGWSSLVLQAGKEAPSLNDALNRIKREGKNDLIVMFDAIIFVVICTLMGKNYKNDENDEKVEGIVASWIEMIEREHGDGTSFILDGKRYPKRRRDFFSSGMVDSLGDLQLSPELTTVFDTVQVLTTIDADAYTSGVTLSSAELEAITVCSDDADTANATAYIVMLMKGANKDKAFALSQSKDVPAARYKAAEQRLRELTVQHDILKNKLDILSAELSEERRRSARREASLVAQQADLNELAALRNALYQLDSSVGGDIVSAGKTRDVPKRFVSLGGLPNWRAEMGKRFPDAKFIPADVALPEDSIRAASELWIEPSYLGHSAYYRAVAVAKAAGVPVKYFPGRNVELCVSALQSGQ